MPATWPGASASTDGGSSEPGATGPQGPRGFTGLPGSGFTWYGTWQQGNAYSKNDVCQFQGTTYVCWNPAGVPAGSDAPDSDPQHWTVMASKGDQGDRGDRGDPGDQGASGDPGTPGQSGTQIVNAGDYNPDLVYDGQNQMVFIVRHEGATYIGAPNGNGPSYVPSYPSDYWALLNVDGSPGDDGLQGAPGADGAQGPKGDTGNAGAAGAKGDPGNQGIQGNAGAAGAAGPALPLMQKGPVRNLPWHTAASAQAGSTGVNLTAGSACLHPIDIPFACDIGGIGFITSAVLNPAIYKLLLLEDYEGLPGVNLYSADVNQAVGANVSQRFAIASGRPNIASPRRVWAGVWNNSAGNLSAYGLGASIGAAIPYHDTFTNWFNSNQAGIIRPGLSAAQAIASWRTYDPAQGEIGQPFKMFLKLLAT